MFSLVIARRLLVLAAVGLAACTPVAAPPAPPAQSTAAPLPSGMPTFTPIELRQLGLCSGNCVVTGAIPFDHPQWKQTWLLTLKTDDGGKGMDATLEYETFLIAVDAGRTIRWQWQGGDWPQFEPASPPTDKTGHLFVSYNPGRYDGLLVLAPAADGFEDFGSLPSKEQMPTSRFYSVSLSDDDHDGIYDIREAVNTCDPTCADANYVVSLYRWDGHDYVRK